MPRIGMIDPSSGREVVRYIAQDRSLRLQLASKRDSIDDQTGQKIPGRTVVAIFKDNVFETDQPEIMEMLEKSIAYKLKDIVREAEVIKEVQEKRYQKAKELLADNPELVERLKEDLRSKQKDIQDREAELTRTEIASVRTKTVSQDTQVKDL